MSRPGIHSAFRRLLEAFSRLEIPYMVVGSLASSVHGVSRATMDIDILADIDEEKLTALAHDLKAEFHADEEDMKDAYRAGRAFNVIHYSSSYKFDVFPLTADPFCQAEFARRKKASFPATTAEESVQFPVASEEDTVLSKLLWYRSGGETSERQWNDALGVVRVRGGGLDLGYIRRWASRLGIEDLLGRLLQQARS